MQMSRKIAFMIPLFLSCFAAVAQPPSDDQEYRNRVITNFNQEAPRVGEPLPDVEILDAQGQPFRLGSLKGHHTVLALGCLT